MRFAIGRLAVLSVAVFALASCSPGDDYTGISTKHENRFVTTYAVDSEWIAYAWSPPNNTKRPVHLVAENRATGEEIEIESNWSGVHLDLDGGILVYKKRNPGSIMAYNLAGGEAVTVATGEVGRPTVSQGTVVFETRTPAGMSVVASAPVSGAFQIDHGMEDRPENVQDSVPKISGQRVVWMRRNLSTGRYALMTYDLRMDETGELPIEHPGRFRFDLDGNTVAFARSGQIGIHDIESGETTVIAEGVDFVDGPAISGGTVAWAEAISEARFRPVGGEPLIDHRDFRDLKTWSFRSGSVATKAESVFMLRRVSVGPDGGVYAVVNRDVSTEPSTVADLVRFD